MAGDGEREFANYSYDASIPAALMFAAIFAMSLAVHIWQAARYKTTWVWGLIFGILFEVVGFITRYIAIKKLHTIWPLLVSETSLISAPAVLAAYLYMLAGRLMSYLGGHYSPVRHQLITKIFVVADFFSISAQALGGSMLAAKTLERLQLGFNILVVALAVQIVILVVFIGIVIVFDIRSRRGLREQRQPVQPLFYVFYVGSGMILLRSIYRLIDFGTIKFTADGVHGYTLTHEWLMYTFDAVPMTICVVVFNWVHAGRFLPAKKGLRIDGSQEAQSATNWLWPLKRTPAKSEKYAQVEMPLYHPNSSTVPLQHHAAGQSAEFSYPGGPAAPPYVDRPGHYHSASVESIGHPMPGNLAPPMPPQARPHGHLLQGSVETLPIYPPDQLKNYQVSEASVRKEYEARA